MLSLIPANIWRGSVTCSGPARKRVTTTSSNEVANANSAPEMTPGAITVSLLLAVATRSPALWALQMVVDLAAGTYALLWAWARSAQAERAEKVRYMPEMRVPELALRRSASS